MVGGIVGIVAPIALVHAPVGHIVGVGATEAACYAEIGCVELELADRAEGVCVEAFAVCAVCEGEDEGTEAEAIVGGAA